VLVLRVLGAAVLGAAGPPARARAAVLSVLALTVLAACRHQVDPIRIDRGVLVVENLTRDEWRNVTVTVNAYYRGTARTLGPGARIEGPLGNFETGLGQRFDMNRERVWRVEVRATTSDGKPVALDWERPRK
jgi:hypothetical protein